jgi:hypothetical protein
MVAKPKSKPTYRIFSGTTLGLLPGEFTERTAAIVAATVHTRTIGTCGIIRSDGDIEFVGAVPRSVVVDARGKIVGQRVEILSVAHTPRA